MLADHTFPFGDPKMGVWAMIIEDQRIATNPFGI